MAANTLSHFLDRMDSLFKKELAKKPNNKKNGGAIHSRKEDLT